MQRIEKDGLIQINEKKRIHQKVKLVSTWVDIEKRDKSLIKCTATAIYL